MAKWQNSYSVRIVENVSPTLATAAVVMPPQLRAAAEKSERIIEEKMKTAYLTGSRRWKPKVDGSRAYLRGKTGELARAVDGLSFDLKVVSRKSKHTVIAQLQADWPRNKRGIEYVWFHEFGSPQWTAGPGLTKTGRQKRTRGPGSLPRREFLKTGAGKAAPEVARQFSLPISSIRYVLRKPASVGITPRVTTSVGGQGGGFLKNLPLLGWLTVLIPPVAPFSQILLAWGMSSDIEMMLSGHMFSPMAMRNMIAGMAFGMTGYSPRVMRRQSRRKLWAGGK